MTWGEQNTEAEGHEQLNWAFDHGINILDSAEMYPIPTKADTQGRTDRIIASWMKRRKREDIVLASKVGRLSLFSRFTISPTSDPVRTRNLKPGKAGKLLEYVTRLVVVGDRELLWMEGTGPWKISL